VQASVAEARGLVARALAAAVVAAAGKVGLVEDVEGAGTAAGMAAEMGLDFPASGAASVVAGLATRMEAAWETRMAVAGATGSAGYTGWPMEAGETATGDRKVAEVLVAEAVAAAVKAGVVTAAGAMAAAATAAEAAAVAGAVEVEAVAEDSDSEAGGLDSVARTVAAGAHSRRSP